MDRFASNGRLGEARELQIESGTNEGTSGDIDLLSYWRIVWMRRWTVFAIFLATVVVALVYTAKQQPTYRAAGTLEIEMPRNPSNVYQAQPAPPENYLATQARILASDQLTARAMMRLNMPSSSAAREDFRKRLNTVLVQNTRLIQVTFEAADANTSATVVNTLFGLYLDQLREGWSESAESLSGVLLKQLKETKDKLEHSVGELQRYAEEHRLPFVDAASPNTDDPDIARLKQLQGELTRLQALRIEKEALYKQAQSVDTLLQDAALNDLREKTLDLRHQEAKLSLTFGPQYPRLQQLQREIRELEQLQASERPEAVEKIGAEYKAVLEQETRLRQLTEQHRMAVEAVAEQRWQYSILKREVDLNKQLYEGLLQQVQQTGLSLQWQGTNARVIDAATPPPKPVRPRLYVNLMAGALMGLTLAIAFVVLEETVLSTFISIDSVETCLNLPLLAALPDVTRAHLNGPGSKNGIAKLNGSDGSTHLRDGQSWFRLDVDTGKACSDLAEALLDSQDFIAFLA